jgi:benzoate membrane transport protein
VAVVLVGNAEGFAILERAGYRPPTRAITTVTALASAVHAIAGAPPATMQKSSLAVLTAPDAGPAAARFWGAIFAAAGALVIAWFALSADSLARAVPAPVVQTLVALALMPLVLNALRGAVSSPEPLPAFLAFLIASSQLDALGFGPATWGLAAGVALTWFQTRPRRAPVTRTGPAADETPCSQRDAAAGRCPETGPVYIMG